MATIRKASVILVFPPLMEYPKMTNDPRITPPNTKAIERIVFFEM
jgi:hypothetical protein